MEVSGQLHAPAALPAGKVPTGTYCIGGRVGSRAGLDVMEKRQISRLYRESKPDSSVVQPEA
jgi:hypothetical protein